MAKLGRSRIAYLQWLKAIAIVMVLVCHCCQMVPRVSVALVTVSTLCFAGVPVFFMVNGALLFNKSLDVRKHVRRAVRFFVLCQLWAVIVGAVNYLEYKPVVSFSVPWIVRYFMGDTEIPNTGHLWYLRVLVTVYVLFPGLKELYDRHYRYFCGLLAVLFVVTFCVNSLNFVLEESNAGFSVDAQQWTLFAERAGACIFFFGLGGCLHRVFCVSGKRIRIVPAVLCAGLGAIGIELAKAVSSGMDGGLMVLPHGYSRVATAFLSIGVVLLVLIFFGRKSTINRFVDYLGSNTLGVYLVHMLWLLPVRTILRYLIADQGSLSWTCVETLFVLALSVLTVETMKRVPLAKRLV